MHPRIAELLQFIDTERTNLRAAVDSVPADQRSESESPDRWSVAGVLEHLSIVETRITDVFRSRVTEGRAAGVGAETDASPILEALDLSQLAVRQERLTAPGALHPTSGLDADQAWAALGDTRRVFRGAVLEADGLALGEITHPHRFFGPFTLYKWIAFIGAHESRHAAQIREIGANLSRRQA